MGNSPQDIIAKYFTTATVNQHMVSGRNGVFVKFKFLMVKEDVTL